MSPDNGSITLGHRDRRGRWPLFFAASMNNKENTMTDRQNAVLDTGTSTIAVSGAEASPTTATPIPAPAPTTAAA